MVLAMEAAMGKGETITIQTVRRGTYTAVCAVRSTGHATRSIDSTDPLSPRSLVLCKAAAVAEARSRWGRDVRFTFAEVSR
jgi:hypothetical protein